MTVPIDAPERATYAGVTVFVTPRALFGPAFVCFPCVDRFGINPAYSWLFDANGERAGCIHCGSTGAPPVGGNV